MEPESLDAYFARILAAADNEQRLPVNTEGMAAWDIYPYELDSLRMRPLQDPMDAEPERFGENPANCWCAKDDASADETIVWMNDTWRLRLLTDSGVPMTLMLSPLTHCDLPTMPKEVAASMGEVMSAVSAGVEKLPSVGRAHIYKYGDGSAHLHWFIVGRPARMSQFRGSPLMDWDENLPAVPVEVLIANARPVVDDVIRECGGERRGFLAD